VTRRRSPDATQTQGGGPAGAPAGLRVASVPVGSAALSQALAGPGHRNLSLIEAALGVTLSAQGGAVAVRAPNEAALDHATAVLDALIARARAGEDLGEGDVRGAIALTGAAASGRPGSHARPAMARALGVPARRGGVTARTPRQGAYLDALMGGRADLVFGVGPAGTGKTFLAVAAGVAMLMEGRIARVVVTRPAVEAGERLGFLPGDLEEKVDPYLQPIWDAFKALLGPSQFERRRAAGEIEIAPLAFMRGRTLTDALVIVDEAQNTTRMQMKMLLTRLGEGSRMAVNGDPSQVDLPRAGDSGLAEALRILRRVEGVTIVTFETEDVVRHPLVGRIVAAYEADAARAREPVAEGPPVAAAPAPAAPAFAPDVRAADPRWAEALGDLDAFSARALGALAEVLEAEGETIAILFTDDDAQRALNARWRGKDKPTNVLSFPAPPAPAGSDPGDGEGAGAFLGDVALAFETCAAEAHAQGKSLADHAAHLLVHGALHLLGYDHESEADASDMEGLEKEVLARLGVADPYDDHG
jgi:phosphate starvation-inducible PhoH-like protein